MSAIAQDLLYPPLEARETGMLRVDDIHALYWEDSGQPDGVPLVFLHGGPGGAHGPIARQFYDPTFYRIIYFHQRGAGSSTPLGETRRNTTQLLIYDMEAIRRHLGIDRWVIAGGSWGSTLALAYAQAHPETCHALLINGVFLGRQQDIDWFFTGSRDFFPEAWAAFLDFLSPSERGDYFGAYARRIMSPDPAVHGPAVRAWSTYEGSIATLVPNPDVLEMFQEPAFALAYSRMNIHYFSNACFLGDTPILRRMGRLRGIPAILVHARYDLATAYATAVELSDNWHDSELVTVPDAGHSRYEPSNVRALLDAQNRLKEMLKGRK